MIDIIIVNYNSSDFTIDCLNSVKDALQGRQAKIYVQDNASSDRPERIQELFPEIILKQNHSNLGFAKAVNQALQQGESEYILLLNPDTRIADDFFDTTLDYMENHPGIGILGPKILDNDGMLQNSARAFPTPLTAFFGRSSFLSKRFPGNPITSRNLLSLKSDGKTPMQVDWVSGACMVIRRKSLPSVGLLDERFFMYWEDADWCRRMWECGLEVVYFPRALVYHYAGGSSEKKPVKSLFEFHKSVYFYLFKKQNAGSFLVPLVLCALFFRFTFLSLFYGIRCFSDRCIHKHRMKDRRCPERENSKKTIPCSVCAAPGPGIRPKLSGHYQIRQVIKRLIIGDSPENALSMSRLKSNFIFSALAVFINAGVSILSVPYITRQVSPTDFGHISLLIVFFYLFAFVDGIRPVIINFVHHSYHHTSDFFRSCHIFSWCGGAVLSCLTFILLSYFYYNHLSFIEIFFISFCALLCIPMTNEAAFLEARERVGFTMIVRSGGWILFYVSYILYATVGASFEWYAMSVAGMNGFLLIIYRIANSDQPRAGKFHLNIIREMTIKIRQVIMFNFCITLMRSLDRLFISRVLPLRLLAHYSVQYEFGFNWNTLVHTAGRVLYPHLSRRMTDEPLALILACWVHINKLIFFTVFSLTLAGFAFSEKIIGLYAGVIYTEHHYVFRFVMVGVAITALGLMAAVFQRVQGDFASQEKAYIIGALTGILLVYPLVSRFGLQGAILVYLSVKIADIILILNIRKSFFPQTDAAKHLLLWPVLFVLCYTLLWYEYYFGFALSYAVFVLSLFRKDDLLFYINAFRTSDSVPVSFE